MVAIVEADAYKMGAGVPLKVTLTPPTVLPNVPAAGMAAFARGDGPMVNPPINTTSPGEIGPVAPLAAFTIVTIDEGGAIAPRSPCCSPWIPAVKYSVLTSPPLPPLPK